MSTHNICFYGECSDLEISVLSGLGYVDTMKIAVKSRNLNADFSKYSLILNKLGTHWIQISGPISELFE